MPDNPTMELMDEVFASKKIFKMSCMGVVAHEIGHLLGAPEVSLRIKKFFKM